MNRKIAPTFLGRLLPQRWRMRRDWDRRAKENALHFIACGHSETDAVFWASGERDLTDLVLHDIELRKNARALEIGCGVGRLLRPLSERIERAYGVDISNEMVEQGRRLLANRPNVEFFVTSGRLRRIANASLDFVFSFIVFQHISTKSAVSQYIREAARMLKGGGIFRFQVDGRRRDPWSAPDTWLGVWYEPAELKRELALSQFDVLDLWGEGTHYLWVTARRRETPRRERTNAVNVDQRAWNRPALDAVLHRMGCDAPGESEAVLMGAKSLRDLARGFLSRHEDASPEGFVREAYRVFLGREADEGGLSFYSREIASGIPRSNTIDCLISSSEFESQLRRIEPAPRG